MWWKQDPGPTQPSAPATTEAAHTYLKRVDTAGWWSWKPKSEPGSDPLRSADPAEELKTEPTEPELGEPAPAQVPASRTSHAPNSLAAPIRPAEELVGETAGGDASAPAARSWAFWGAKNPVETESTPKKPRTQTPSTLVPTFDQSFAYPPLIGRWWAKPPYRTSPKHIKRAVVIGIHGYFPARIARTFLGEPTGTSVKFASEGAAMLEAWAKTNRINLTVEKIALEGEGRIAEREHALFELLKNWMETLRQADFIFFAVHSQGAVVGVHIIARLIEEYKISAKIGLLSMAGVCLGPMPGMDQSYVMKAISTIENASLLELFELQNPHSTQSLKYRKDLDAVLRHGVKTVFVASADDQLVPLYSALCTQADHPNIFRAVYLDGDTISPKFLAPLLSLAVRRRNGGHSDHGFFADISNAIAGSLTGSGHSRLYSSDQVYTLALRTILETSCTTNKSPKFHDFSLPKQNPYLLPWSVHAMLTDAAGSPQLAENVEELYRDYGSWKPSSKPMKDLKYRLAALKKTKL